MNDVPFEALRMVYEVVVFRAPELLRVLSYRCLYENRTTVPRGLWLALLERANGDMSLGDSASSHHARTSSLNRPGLPSTSRFGVVCAPKYLGNPKIVASAGIGSRCHKAGVIGSRGRFT